MNTLKKQTVGQIAATDYRKARVFKKYGIDFYCKGNITIDTACKARGIKPYKLLIELANLKKREMKDVNYNHWPLDILIDYIVNTHHQYLRENFSEIEFYAETVKEAHGDTHRELLSICIEISELSDEMKTHIKQEEKQLFPFIKRLVSDKDYSRRDEEIDCQEVINATRLAHKQVRNTLKRIRELSHYYQLPANASTTYSVFYESLAALDDDLHKHIHLENDILFTKALELNQKQT